MVQSSKHGSCFWLTGVPYRSGLAGLVVGADAGEFETGGAGHVADAAGEAIEADGGDEAVFGAARPRRGYR